MRIQSLIHVKHEDIGAIAQWAEYHNHEVNSTNLYLGESLPPIDDFDMLVIMGGPMSVNDEYNYGWLKEEKRFIKKAIDSNKIVIGICLGAQLIASALGASVRNNEHKEIGWFPVKKAMWVSHPVADYLPFYFTTFHWHGEIFDIPEGAVRILESDACENQAFVYRSLVAAFQFHMEFTPESLQEMVNKGESELEPDEYVQSANDILAKMINCGENNLYLFRVLDYLSYKYSKMK